MNSEPMRYPLTSLYLYLTDRCNLNCGHCWISPDFTPVPDSEEPADPSVSELLNFVDQARLLGLNRVKLTGGEPMLYPGFFDLVESLSSRGIGLDLETNATLIGPWEAEYLAGTTALVSVSLDGASSGTHDSARGVKGAFTRSISALRELAGHGAATQVIMTLTRTNICEIEPIIRLAGDLGVSSIKINPVVPCGRAQSIFDRDQNLSPEELMALDRKLSENPGETGIQVELDLPVGLKSLKNLTSASQGVCMIRNILGVLSDGSLALCGIGQVEPDLVLGTLEDDLARIWNEADLFIWLREKLVEELEGICGRCFFRFSCLGACRANAYAVEKRLTAPFYLCQEAYNRGIFPSSRYE